MKIAIEKEIETAIQCMIAHELGGDTYPVYRSDQTPASPDIECIVISVNRESDPELINQGGKSLHNYSAQIELWSHGASENPTRMSERFQAVDDAMNSEESPPDLDLSRFDAFVVMEGGQSESEIDGDGRRTRRRQYSLKIQEVAG